MNITKKVCIYILVGLITITGTFTSFYKGVYAFEYVGGALAFEEAIKWLLASVGIISAGGMTADYWEQHGDEFVDYCTEQNITDTEVANWQLKLCEGILDKGSACWQAFKEWASTLTDSSSGGGSGSGSGSASGSIADACAILGLVPSNGFTFKYPNYNFTHACAYFNPNGNTTVYFFSDSCDVYKLDNVGIYFKNASGFDSYEYYRINFWGNTTDNLYSGTTGVIRFYDYENYLYGFGAWQNVIDNTSFLHNWDISGSGSTDSDFISVQPDVTDLDIISSPIPDTDAQEVAIPMPGVSDSDNEASADAYDNIVDQVNDGTLELDDAITQVIDTLKIIVYEQETEKIFPKPDNEEDQEDLDDKINQNKDNMAFTLGGLENVFPFCIPWDIYAFMSLLRADPVPPKIELPFPNPLHPDDPWLVEVDFADWDNGMRIVRLAEDFLFIIGLAVLTRSLIGAGGGDG